MSDLLIQNGTVLTMAPDEEVVSGGAVAIRDGRIAAVGKPADLKRMGFGEGKTLNARGQVILPGLVNPHVHATGVLLKAVPKASSARSARPQLPRLLFAEADAYETEVLARGVLFGGPQERCYNPGPSRPSRPRPCERNT